MFDRILRLVVLAGCTFPLPALCGDWISAPSYYTHDQSGQRVQQYTPIGPFYIYPSPDFQRSGYRHTRSSIQVGSSVDHLHLVEEWGRPVRPYDEWRLPYRPYSAPYPEWGPPYAGLGFGFGAGHLGWPGVGGPIGGGHPGAPNAGFGHGGRHADIPYQDYQPWFDDRYPAFDDRAPWRQEPFPRPKYPHRPMPGQPMPQPNPRP